MSIMLTIFDVSIKEKSVYGSLCLSYFLSKLARVKQSTWSCASMQISTSRSCWRPYLELFNGILRVAYVTWAINSIRHHN